jgi:ADP-heptose:LPS heptosyltransferase
MRSLDLQALCSALNFPMVRFVNLQYGDVSRDLAALDASVQSRMFICPDIDNLRDLDGLAALMCNCDLIVTVGNTTAHLAGALGLKAWVLLPFSPSWRWMNSGSQTPWYPALRLYRQAATKDWQSVLGQVRRDFTQRFLLNTLGVSQ